MFQVALSSFSHLTFRARHITLKKIFSQLTKTAISFINPLFNMIHYFSPFTRLRFSRLMIYLAKSCHISLRLCASPNKGPSVRKTVIFGETRIITVTFSKRLNIKSFDILSCFNHRIIASYHVGSQLRDNVMNLDQCFSLFVFLNQLTSKQFKM